MTTKSKTGLRLLLYLLPVVLLLAGVTIWLMLLLNRNTIYDGIRVKGMDISGMTSNHALNFLEANINTPVIENVIQLKYDDKVWKVKLEDISFSYDITKAVNLAYRSGRNGSFTGRLQEIFNLRRYGREITPELRYDSGKIKQILESIKSEIDTESKNASLEYKNDKVTIKKHTLGRSLDIEKSLRNIENHINYEQSGIVDLVVEEQKPELLYEDIKDIKDIIGSYTTYFNPKDKNRTDNLKLSCQKIDGLILKPGEVFSMNETLGERTAENGYKDAKIIIKNEYVEGMGGGVCQVTTTLYDAVLMSLLEVVERFPHSLPSVYVAPGLDATIAESYLDFKFANNLDHAIYIDAKVSGSSLRIRILGKKDAKVSKVKLVPKVIEWISPKDPEIILDSDLEMGKEIIEQHAKNGMRVIVYREVYDDKGKLLKREKISDDRYKPIRGRIRVGKKLSPTQNLTIYK